MRLKKYHMKELIGRALMKTLQEKFSCQIPPLLYVVVTIHQPQVNTYGMIYQHRGEAELRISCEQKKKKQNRKNATDS